MAFSEYFATKPHRFMKRTFSLFNSTCTFGVLLLLLSNGSSTTTHAQMTGFSVELDTLFHPNQDSGVPELETFGVYRIYAEMTNSDDYLSAISNISTEGVGVWSLTSEGTFFNDTLGGNLGPDINPLFFGTFPSLAYDSWWTIGLEPGAVAGAISVAMDPAITPFEDWNMGNDFVANTFVGGSIFVPGVIEYQPEIDPITQDTVDTYPVVVGPPSGLGGENLKVLVAQVTVNHSFAFEACAQVFPIGIQANQQQFCPEAIVVEHPYADGACVNDGDGDGVCDEFEVAGCTDEMACNYDPAATEENDTCEYASDIYGCDGNCVNDADGDGVCDELEVAGCTDPTACNFDQAATDNDGSCLYSGELCDDGNPLTYADEIQNCECLGFSCHDADACNYSLAGIQDNSLCEDLEVGVITGNATPFSQTLQTYTYTTSSVGSTFEWNVVGGDILGGNGTNELTVVWNEEGPGALNLVESSAAGCTGMIDFFVDISLSSVEEVLDGSLEVFPIPTVDHLQLVWTGPTLDNATVSMRDAAGRIVMIQSVAERDVLQLGGLGAGIYTLEFTVPFRGSIQRRIMVQ